MVASVAEDIAKGIQNKLRNQIDKNDVLLNKHVIIENVVAKVKRSTEDKINTIA
jgi:hypothetical protein